MKKTRRKMSYKFCQKVGDLFRCTEMIKDPKDSSKDRVCGKVFKTKSNFQVHERSHTGEKPYACKYCDRRFTSSGNRREHHRRHNDNKIYKCEAKGCKQSFHRFNILILHYKKVHKMTVTDSKKGNGGRIKYRDAKLDTKDGRQINDTPQYDNFVRGIPQIFRVEKCRERDPVSGKIIDLDQPEILNEDDSCYQSDNFSNFQDQIMEEYKQGNAQLSSNFNQYDEMNSENSSSYEKDDDDDDVDVDVDDDQQQSTKDDSCNKEVFIDFCEENASSKAYLDSNMLPQVFQDTETRTLFLPADPVKSQKDC